MLNRNIPVYEGNLPYLYACYSPEDEMLVLPVLARMYNEGFRVWSACLCDKVSDFVAVRHVSTSSCVMMFMSHNMIERINSGVPEVLAACRSSLLRTVVLLDDVRPDSRFFALTTPEYMEYQRSNDSSFWLYAYSADYLERCRGPWPQVKISMREPAYEDVQEEAIAAEYISLDNIINRGSEPEIQSADKQKYPNNRGYIQPAPDPLKYELLSKVEPARTVHDRDYDDALALLNQCAEKQINIIINHTRPGENTVAAVPTLSPLKPMPDQSSELDIIRREIEAEGMSAQRPERRLDPQVKTKADMIVEPEEKKSEEQEKATLPETAVPQPELTVSSIAASIKAIAEAENQPEEIVADIPVESAAPVFEKENVLSEPEVEIIWEENNTAAADNCAFEKDSDAGRSTVQVVVRRQPPVVRVTPVKKRVITEPVYSGASSQSGKTKTQAVRHTASAQSRALEREEAASFEQYIRDIALSAVSSAENVPEQPVTHRRFGRTVRAAEQAAETVPVETAVAEEAVQETAAAVAAPETVEEKTSPRKNRHRHDGEILTGLIAALRRERMAALEDAVETAAETVISVPVSVVSIEPEQTAVQEPVASVHPEESALKVIKLSDAISERKINDLQAAVNKFMHLDNAPEAAPLTVRAYMRRR